MKRCSGCRAIKALGEFHKNAAKKDGLHSYCRPCNSARAGQWYRANPERAAAYHRARKLRGYGLTPERFDAMVDRQASRCAICQTSVPGGRHGQWHVDHDHSCCPGRRTCGECVRGLLCNRCNTIVVPVLEDAPLRESGIRYLTNPPAKQLWGDDVPRQEPQ